MFWQQSGQHWVWKTLTHQALSLLAVSYEKGLDLCVRKINNNGQYKVF